VGSVPIPGSDLAALQDFELLLPNDFIDPHIGEEAGEACQEQCAHPDDSAIDVIGQEPPSPGHEQGYQGIPDEITADMPQEEGCNPGRAEGLAAHEIPQADRSPPDCPIRIGQAHKNADGEQRARTILMCIPIDRESGQCAEYAHGHPG